MADIVSAQNKLNDVEVSDGAAISQSLMTKIGANINYLIDNQNNYQNLSLKTQTFTAIGASTFTVPAGVTKLIVYGCGGGGGGAGGSGGGGAGAGLGHVILDVLPGQIKAVQVGVGGPGGSSGNNGGTGADSVFDTVTFYGASGGWAIIPGAFGNPSVADFAQPSSGGGSGGAGPHGVAPARNGAPGTAALGGIAFQGGGGGGGYLGNGGNGGSGSNPGANATGYGCGGGGGGIGATGGAGSQGIIIVTWVGE